nr:Maf family protein [Lachnospiraceae bacterium]
MKIEDRTIILASQSPRRKELLTSMGLTFITIPSEDDEVTAFSEPASYVCDLSLHKAMDVYRKEQPSHFLMIGADTIVAHKGQLLGKPADADAALIMLRNLQGDTHQVYTGVTLLWDDDGLKQKTFCECTDVHVAPMSDAEILSYIATGEPFDKAGGYGIQTSFGKYVSGIAGDYNNVVGLPVARLYMELK